MGHERLTEYQAALELAERLLDEPNADPDDDLRVLSRQLTRSAEREARLRNREQERSYTELADFARMCFGNFFTRGKWASEVLPTEEIEAAIDCCSQSAPSRSASSPASSSRLSE